MGHPLYQVKKSMKNLMRIPGLGDESLPIWLRRDAVAVTGGGDFTIPTGGDAPLVARVERRSRAAGARFSEVCSLTSKIEQYAKDDAQIYVNVIGNWTVGGYTQQLRCPPK